MQNSLLLTNVMLGMVARTAAVGALITNARNEGRDVSSEELQALADADEQARGELVDAIAAARAEGR